MDQRGFRSLAGATIALVLCAGLLPSCAFLSRASESSTGEQGDLRSYAPALSDDGRWVAFISDARNLVPGDTDEVADVFVRDNWTKAMSRVSVSSTGAQTAELPVYYPAVSISSDGRIVAFASDADDLTANDGNARFDVFWHDRDTDQDGVFDEPGAIATVLASARPDGNSGNGQSLAPALNADGSVLAFQSSAPDLVAAPDQDTNDTADVFAATFDLANAQRAGTRIVSRRPADPTTQANDASGWPSIDGSGRVIAFTTRADNLIPGDTTAFQEIAVNDGFEIRRGTGAVEGNGESIRSTLSRDATRVAYISRASNLVLGDTEANLEIFVTDYALTGVTLRPRPATSGSSSTTEAGFVSISADGARVAYASLDPNIVAGDTNDSPDAFVHDFRSGVTQRVSTNVALQEGALGSGYDSAESPVALSADGRFVAFATPSDLLPPDTNGASADILVRGAMVPVIGSVALIDPLTHEELLPRLFSGTQQLIIHGKAFGPSVVVNLGADVTASVTAATATGILVEATVAPTATAGTRNVVVQNRGTVGALAAGTLQICGACVTVAN